MSTVATDGGGHAACDVCAERDDFPLLAVARLQITCTSLEAGFLGVESGSGGLDLCETHLQAAAGGAVADPIAGQVEQALCGYGEERREWRKYQG